MDRCVQSRQPAPRSIKKDGVALAPKYGYSCEGPSLCTFTDYLTHALQGFLLVGTLAENSFKIAVIKYISKYIFISIYIIFIIKILLYYT